MTSKDRLDYHNWQVRFGKIDGEMFDEIDAYLDWYEEVERLKYKEIKRIRHRELKKMKARLK